MGEALSFLARRGASMSRPLRLRNGFYIFSVEDSAPKFGPEDVQAALEAEDQERGSGFFKAGR